jgi:SAM-dependent methyltransferase
VRLRVRMPPPPDDAVPEPESGWSDEDARFDRIYPEPIRRLSRMHWTPVEVARRASRFLACSPGARILDVGSGVGKFCLLGALETQAYFVGAECRGDLVEVARVAARRARASRAEFLHLDALELDWSEFDGLYLFNPFEELLFPDDGYIDKAVEFGERRFHSLVLRTEEKLRRMPLASRLAVFHSTGGEAPCGYRQLGCETVGPGTLEFWERALPPGPCGQNDCLDCAP